MKSAPAAAADAPEIRRAFKPTEPADRPRPESNPATRAPAPSRAARVYSAAAILPRGISLDLLA